MAMQFLKAEKQAAQYHFQIWLDTTKSVNGNPDNNYVVDYYWTLTPPQGVAVTAYETQIQSEAKLLAQAALQAKTGISGTALGSQGTTF